MEIKELNVISLKENEMLLITVPAGLGDDILQQIGEDVEKTNNNMLKGRVLVVTEDVKFSKTAVDK